MLHNKSKMIFFSSIFIVLLAYLWAFFKPSLLYFHFQPAFYFDAHFLSELLNYPGGIADGLSLFIFQFFYNDFIGSLLFASLLLGIALLLQAHIRCLFQSERAALTTLIPVYLLMALYNNYNLPLVIAAKFFLVLLVGTFYVRGNNVIRLFLLIALPIVYWIIGGWFCLFLVIIVLSVHLVTRFTLLSLIFPALFFLIYCLSAFVSARFIFQIPLKEALLYIIPVQFYYDPFLFKLTPLFFAPFLAVPVLFLVWRLKDFMEEKFTRIAKARFVRLYLPTINMLAALLVLCPVLLLSLNRETRRKIYIDELAVSAQWEKILTEAKHVQAYDRVVEFQTNRAMYFTGCLLDSLFSIEHPVGVDGLFTDRIIASQIAMPASDLYFDLAHINASQVMAYEYLTKFRYHPPALKRLVLTNAINGQMHKAEKFLGLLRKSLVHKPWAVKHAFVLDEKKLMSEPLFREKRVFMAKRDFFLHAKNPNLDMLSLLQSNNQNKMAFEYLMAYYLLECKLGNIVAHLSLLKQFDYKYIPRHLMEAAIMYQSGAEKAGSEIISDFPFRVDKFNEFMQFNRIISENKTDKTAAMRLLKAQFGDTFWYYLLSGGAARNTALKQRKIESLY